MTNLIENSYFEGYFETVGEQAASGDWDGVLKTCDLALTLDLSDERRSGFFGWRGFAYVFHGNLEAAIDEFNQCIRLDSEQFPALHMRALCHFDLGNFDQAKQDHKRFEEVLNEWNWAHSEYSFDERCLCWEQPELSLLVS